MTKLNPYQRYLAAQGNKAVDETIETSKVEPSADEYIQSIAEEISVQEAEVEAVAEDCEICAEEAAANQDDFATGGIVTSTRRERRR